MMKREVVKIKVHAGCGWIGQVVFTAINPDNPNDNNLSSDIEEIVSFCNKRGLLMDEDFKLRVFDHLVHTSKYGFVVPPDLIDEDRQTWSGYLKSHFYEYYTN
jgi:hypothetical protein